MLRVHTLYRPIREALPQQPGHVGLVNSSVSSKIVNGLSSAVVEVEQLLLPISVQVVFHHQIGAVGQKAGYALFVQVEIVEGLIARPPGNLDAKAAMPKQVCIRLYRAASAAVCALLHAEPQQGIALPERPVFCVRTARLPVQDDLRPIR